MVGCKVVGSVVGASVGLFDGDKVYIVGCSEGKAEGIWVGSDVGVSVSVQVKLVCV